MSLLEKMQQKLKELEEKLEVLTLEKTSNKYLLNIEKEIEILKKQIN